MKNKAFTLAEVLITLGVIGVVAAMTLPTLINNIQGEQYRSKFKKDISLLNQAITMNKAKYDWDFAGLEVSCDSTFRAMPEEKPSNKKSICALLNGNLKGLSWNKIYPSNDNYKLDGNEFYKVEFSGALSNTEYMSGIGYDDVPSITLADGALLSFAWWQTKGCSLPVGSNLNNELNVNEDLASGCIGIIDVNGKRGPNKEIKCSNGVDTALTPDTPCIVDKNDIIAENSKFGYSEHIKLAKKIIGFGSLQSQLYVMNNSNKNPSVLPNIVTIYHKDDILIKTKNHRRKKSNESEDNSLNNSNNNTSSSSINSKRNSINEDESIEKKENLSNNDINILYETNLLYKGRNQSRFDFANNNNNLLNRNDDNVLKVTQNLIDDLSSRIAFFIQFNKNIPLSKLEYEYCNNIYIKSKNDEIKKIIQNLF